MSNELEILKLKHSPFSQHFGSVGPVEYCAGCKTDLGSLLVSWPCDVIKAINATYDTIEFQEWHDLGQKLGYCSDQFCLSHDGMPMSELEESIDATDMCMHFVRLGSAEQWQQDAEWFVGSFTE